MNVIVTVSVTVSVSPSSSQCVEECFLSMCGGVFPLNVCSKRLLKPFSLIPNTLLCVISSCVHLYTIDLSSYNADTSCIFSI